MRFTLLAPAVAAVALAGTTLTSGVAMAQTPSAPVSAAAAAPYCGNGLTNMPAKESVKIRSTPKVKGTALGVWGKGQKGFICNDGKSIKGEKYTLCGKTSTEWLYGINNSTNVKGYVPRACMKW